LFLYLASFHPTSFLTSETPLHLLRLSQTQFFFFFFFFFTQIIYLSRSLCCHDSSLLLIQCFFIFLIEMLPHVPCEIIKFCCLIYGLLVFFCKRFFGPFVINFFLSWVQVVFDSLSKLLSLLSTGC
jgi:hypothetical protein